MPAPLHVFAARFNYEALARRHHQPRPDAHHHPRPDPPPLPPVSYPQAAKK
jgi:hypothetical protein